VKQVGSNHKTSRAKLGDKLVFVKEFADDVKGFRNTVRSLLKLEHPGIIKILGLAVEPKSTLVEMPFYEQTLTDWLGNAQSANSKRAVLVGLCFALHYAHEKDVVHLDIKPHNVMINALGQPVLTDFDLASVTDAAGAASTAATGRGTEDYKAPELSGLVRAAPSSDSKHRQKFDVWSLGCVAYQMITGKQQLPPFFAQHLCDGSLKLSQDIKEPASLDLVRKLLTADPAKRPRVVDILELPYFASVETKAFIPGASRCCVTVVANVCLVL
jgi:serine/threonine protein kinase